MNDDQKLLRDAVPLRSVREHVTELTSQVERSFQRGNGLVGLATGFRDLDALTGGLLPGQLIFVAGRPSMGKSALAAQIANDVCLRNKPVLYFSLDFGADELVRRMAAAEARVDVDRIKRCRLNADERARLAAAAHRLGEAPLVIEETPSPTVEHIVARCRQQRAEREVALVVIDHLQLISTGEAQGSWLRRMTQVCLGLKAAARTIGAPLLCLSELNRGPESRADHRPVLWDLRDAGAIELAADIIGCLYREEYYALDRCPEDKLGIAELIVSKNKAGPTGVVELRFSWQHLRYDDLDVKHT